MQKLSYFAVTFFNLDNLVNIIYKLFTFGVVILDIIIEGTVSLIFYLGPSSFFM